MRKSVNSKKSIKILYVFIPLYKTETEFKMRIFGSVMVFLLTLIFIASVDVPVYAQAEKLQPDKNASRSSPEIIRETVDADAESWSNSIGFGRQMDWVHLEIYKCIQSFVDKLDYRENPPTNKMLSGFYTKNISAEVSQMAMNDAVKQIVEGLTDAAEFNK